MLKPQTRLEWSFFGATATQAVVNTALQFYVLSEYLCWVNPDNVYQVPRSYTLPVTIGLIVFGCLYQLILTVDAFRIKNNIQLFAQCLCNVCLFVSSVLQYEQTEDVVHGLPDARDQFNKPLVHIEDDIWPRIQPALIACSAVCLVASIIMCGLAYRLHKEFAWALYKDISVDASLRTRYIIYQVYLVLLKLSFYFLIAFLIIYGLVDVHYDNPEFALTFAIIPCALLQIALGVHCTRRESRPGMALILVVFLAGVAYLVSRIVLICGSGKRANTGMKDEILFFAFVALFFVSCATAAAVACFVNFGRGLKGLLLGQTQRKAPEAPDDDYRFQRLSYAPVSGDAVLSPRRFALD